MSTAKELAAALNVLFEKLVRVKPHLSVFPEGGPPRHPLSAAIALEEHRLTELLRSSEEGASVTLTHPNAEGEPAEAIEVTGSWTGWDVVRYTGFNLIHCLRLAVYDMKSKKVREAGTRVFCGPLDPEQALKLAHDCFKSTGRGKPMSLKLAEGGEPWQLEQWVVDAIVRASRGEYAPVKPAPAEEQTVDQKVDDAVLKASQSKSARTDLLDALLTRIIDLQVADAVLGKQDEGLSADQALKLLSESAKKSSSFEPHYVVSEEGNAKLSWWLVDAVQRASRGEGRES